MTNEKMIWIDGKLERCLERRKGINGILSVGNCESKR